MKRLLALALCALWLGSCSGDQPSAAPASQPPAAASIQIVDHSGLETELTRRKGSAYLINVWAMWCAPCVAELPELLEVADEYRERGGSVLGISYDLMVAGADEAGIEPTMKEFFVAKHLNMPVLIYDEADYEQINQRFDLPGAVPVTLAIDKTGAIVDRQEGPADRARFDEMMRKALGL